MAEVAQGGASSCAISVPRRESGVPSRPGLDAGTKGAGAMWRKFLCVVFALLVFTGGLFAFDATVVKVEPLPQNNCRIHLQIGNASQVVDANDVKLVNAAGKEIKAADLKIKAGDKVEVSLMERKVVEIKILSQ
jgi:hypothetical protein